MGQVLYIFALFRTTELCSSQQLLQSTFCTAVNCNYDNIQWTLKQKQTKMDRNPPITIDKRDLMTQLKRTCVSWQVCLDDWWQRKMYFVVAVDLSRVIRMFLKMAIIVVLLFIVEIPDKHWWNSGSLPFTIPFGWGCIGIETAITISWTLLWGP